MRSEGISEFYYDCSAAPAARGESVSMDYLEPLDEISFDQSTEQSFYFIENIEKDGEELMITGDQWIVSYCNDEIVGSRQWLGEMIDVPAMGNDGNEYSNGYCVVGDIPEFKLYDSSTGEYLVLDINNVPEWSSNEINILGTGSASSMHIPNQFTLSSVYPNPFNPVTSIEFGIPEDMDISIDVYDISGRQVASIVDGLMESGYHTIAWDASNFSSGVYLLKVSVGNEIHTRKLMLMK